MLRIVSFLLCFVLAAAASAQSADSIVGSWQFKNKEMEIVVELSADGTFRQVNISAKGREAYSGRYQLTGQMLYFLPQGASQPMQLMCRFLDGDTLQVTYPSGESRQWKRLKPAGAAFPQEKPSQPPKAKPDTMVKVPADQSSLAQPAKKRPTLLMQRTWEPNEKAFTFLLPKGWKTQGGIFNVNPQQMNGPGNTIAPKCDLTVKSDDRGTIMLRLVPSWNYADLTYASTGSNLFRPGQHYQGMLVKLLPSPKQFLTELFQTTQPQATDVKIVAEDPMREVVEACQKSSQQINLQLRQKGLRPNSYEAMAMLVEYNEGGQRFHEALLTMIADSRGGALMWTNENTITFRAPAGEFEVWKPVLDTIRSSVQMNPQWVAAVTRAMGDRAKNALETQRYINKVANEIVENRRRTNAEIRHEQWLFITGQEEYKNPFTGQMERDRSDYRYRWVNNQGDYLYSDENSFDPNRYEEYNTREWKRTPIRQR
jgi:hypothetical protein